MTNKIVETFDYGNINEENQKTVSEVINLINQLPDDTNIKMLATLLENKFKLVEIPRYDAMQTEIVNKALKVGLVPTIAGWNQSITSTGNDMLYPIIYFSADIRKFIELGLELKK